MFIHDINPEILKLGPLSLRYYGIFICLGIVCAFLISRKFARLLGYSDVLVEKIIFVDLIGLFLGAHLVHILFYEPYSIFNDPVRILDIRSGLASHGGFLGVTLATYIMSRRHKFSFPEFLDILAVGGGIVVPFIRLGNFFNSEIIGRKTDLPWGVIFKYRNHVEPRHPSQIYELLMGLVVFILVYFFYRKYYRRIREGTLILTCTIAYFTSRFFVEYVKEYQFLSPSFPLTMGQLLSLPLMLIGIVLFIRWKCYRLLPEPRPVIQKNSGKRRSRK